MPTPGTSDAAAPAGLRVERPGSVSIELADVRCCLASMRAKRIVQPPGRRGGGSRTISMRVAPAVTPVAVMLGRRTSPAPMAMQRFHRRSGRARVLSFPGARVLIWPRRPRQWPALLAWGA